MIQSSLNTKEEAVTDAPEGAVMQMPEPVERVLIPSAAVQIQQVDDEHTVLAFLTPMGRSYEFMLDANGKKAVVRKLTGGVEIASALELPR